MRLFIVAHSKNKYLFTAGPSLEGRKVVTILGAPATISTEGEEWDFNRGAPTATTCTEALDTLAIV